MLDGRLCTVEWYVLYGYVGTRTGIWRSGKFFRQSFAGNPVPYSPSRLALKQGYGGENIKRGKL